MEPIPYGLITGGLNLLGGFFSSNTSAQNTQANIAAQAAAQQRSEEFNAAEAEKSRQFSADQAMINRGFQESMSSSAHQREVSDLRAAGLNPILSAGGSGSSTPSGAMGSGPAASISTPNVSDISKRTSPWANLGQVAGSVVSSAIQAKTFDKMTEEIANLRADNAKIVADANLQTQRKSTEEQSTALEGERVRTQREDTLKRAQENSLLGLSMTDARVKEKAAAALERMPSWLRDAVVQSDFVGSKISGALSPISSITHSARNLAGTFSNRFFY